MSQQATGDLHAGLLRAWHLAILRFALTHENADRLGVLAIANEIDRLDRPHDVRPCFSFFRRTSAELCAAMMLRQDTDDAVFEPVSRTNRRYPSPPGDGGCPGTAAAGKPGEDTSRLEPRSVEGIAIASRFSILK